MRKESNSPTVILRLLIPVSRLISIFRFQQVCHSLHLTDNNDHLQVPVYFNTGINFDATRTQNFDGPLSNFEGLFDTQLWQNPSEMTSNFANHHDHKFF